MTTRQYTKQICKMHTILNDFLDALYIKIYKDHVFSRGFYCTRVLKQIRTVGRTENDFFDPLYYYWYTLDAYGWKIKVHELRLSTFYTFFF
jgi:hypothetical protein